MTGDFLARADDVPEHLQACSACAARIVAAVLAAHDPTAAVNTLVRAVALILVGTRVSDPSVAVVALNLPAVLMGQVGTVRAEAQDALRDIPAVGSA